MIAPPRRLHRHLSLSLSCTSQPHHKKKTKKNSHLPPDAIAGHHQHLGRFHGRRDRAHVLRQLLHHRKITDHLQRHPPCTVTRSQNRVATADAQNDGNRSAGYPGFPWWCVCTCVRVRVLETQSFRAAFRLFCIIRRNATLQWRWRLHSSY